MSFIPAARKQTHARPVEVLKSTTVRGFDGGWNVTDSDLNMEPRYATKLDNIERGIDGSLSVRPGSKLFARLANTSPIVNIAYFNAFIIAIQANGNISKVDGTGVETPLYLPGSTTPPWPSGFVFASFTVFNSDLIITNGVNKPLILPGDPNDPSYMTLQYLQDLASLTNINTPIGAFVCSHAQYTIIAGLPTRPSTIIISARGTSGTYPGDPAPNDAVEIDLGPRVSLGSSTITGLVAYRDKLLVTFERGILPLNLGIYKGDPEVHTPSDDGFIEEFGCLAHRSLVSVGDDTYFCDNVGVNSITRIITFNTLRPVRASVLVDPEIIAAITPLSPAQIARYVFSVYDMRNKRYILFIPTFDGGGNLVETVGFSYTDNQRVKTKPWGRLRGWKWSCATRTALQNIIFAYGNKLYSYNYDGVTSRATDEAGIVADFVDDTDVRPDGRGVPVEFDWEMPWADFDRRLHQKQSKYIHVETTGRGTFECAMYLDRVRTDANGDDSPLLSMTMVAGDSGGWGNAPWGSGSWGGGRPSNDEMLQPWPAKFNLAKFRFRGSTTMPIRFVSLTLLYQRGSPRR